MDKKILRNDIILISSLVIAAGAGLTAVLLTRQSKNLVANVYLQSDLIEIIDLSKKEDKYYTVQGLHTEVKIHTKVGAIAIVESGCPHKDCIYTGYVSQTNRPIICAYNGISIMITSTQEGGADIVI